MKIKKTNKLPYDKAVEVIKNVEVDMEGISVHIKTHKDNKGGHPHVIVDNVDDKHVSVGLTTKKKKGKNATNYKLSVNPLGGKQQSYMRRQGTVDDASNYHSPRQGTMTPKDYDQAKIYGNRAKQKYLDEKNKKK